MATKTSSLIHFDDLNRLRLLHPDHFTHTEAIAEDAKLFIAKTQTFATMCADMNRVLAAESALTEKAKLTAIGKRNLIDAERDNRHRKEAAVMEEIAQANAQLQRLQRELTSLQKVEAEQRQIIDKLNKP